MTFRSHEELFQAVAKLLAELEGAGRADAVAELRSGLACLNGLTDGWALFLESIDKVQAGHAKALADTQRRALAAIRAAVYSAVYRR
jgi:hypothetical protein